MSYSISAISSQHAQFDTAPAAKQTAKPTETEQIKLLASQGHSAQVIASTVGLPEALIDVEIGTTTATSSSSSQATALLALGARLSVQA